MDCEYKARIIIKYMYDLLYSEVGEKLTNDNKLMYLHFININYDDLALKLFYNQPGLFETINQTKYKSITDIKHCKSHMSYNIFRSLLDKLISKLYMCCKYDTPLHT